MFTTETGELDIKKIIRLAAFIVIVALLAVALWFILTRGGLKVETASKDAQISVTAQDTGEEIATPSKSGVSFLPVGSYVVTVTDGKKQSKTFASVERFGIKTVSLTPPELSSIEPVANFTTRSFAVSSTGLSVHDAEKDQLIFVDANNTVKKTELTTLYDTAVWQSPGNGYAVARSSEDRDTRQFMRISNGVAAPFATPAPFTQSTYLAFAVDEEGTLYVLQDGTLYKRFSSVYEKVLTTNKEAVFLSANKTYITLQSHGSDEKCELQIIKAGSTDIKKLPIECIHNRDYRYSAEWTEDSSRLAATTGSALAVYNDELKPEYTVPDSTATNPLWLNNTTLVYVSGNNVWKYDLSTKTSSVISTVPTYITLQDLKVQDDGKTLYFTGRTENFVSLYRTADPKKDTTTVQKINESNMHTLGVYCTIRFVNFTKLAISASTAPNEREGCGNEIKNYFDMIQVTQPPVQFDSTEFNFPTD